MTYIIYYVTASGRQCSMPSSERQLQDDVEWLLGNGDTIVLIKRFDG